MSNQIYSNSFNTYDIPNSGGVTGPQGIQGPTGATGTNSVSTGTINDLVQYASANSLSDSGIQSSAVVTLSGTQALTNKTLALDTNTINGDGNLNTRIGTGALSANAGNFNCAYGRDSLSSNISGNENVGLGLNSLSQNTTGSSNTACGTLALENNVSGSENVACGQFSLAANVSGGRNIGVGVNALDGLSSGSMNIGIGFQAGQSLTTGSNNIYIGHEGVPAVESNVIRIGEGITNTFIDGISGATTSAAGLIVLVDNTGNLGTVDSTGAVGVTTTGTQILTNKTISNLVSTGTTDSMLSGNIIRYTYTASTVGAVAATILLNQATTTNSSIQVEVFANGYCTAGTDINGSVALNAYQTRVKNHIGTATASGFLSNISSDADGGLGAATVTFTTSTSTYSIQLNGVVTDTISWSGDIWIYY